MLNDHTLYRFIRYNRKSMFPLKVMLMNKNWAEHEEKRIILKETPACQNVFEVNTNIGAVRIAKKVFLR